MTLLEGLQGKYKVISSNFKVYSSYFVIDEDGCLFIRGKDGLNMFGEVAVLQKYTRQDNLPRYDYVPNALGTLFIKPVKDVLEKYIHIGFCDGRAFTGVLVSHSYHDY